MDMTDDTRNPRVAPQASVFTFKRDSYPKLRKVDRPAHTANHSRRFASVSVYNRQ